MDKHAHAPYPFIGPHLAHTSPCKINLGIRYWSYDPANFIATNNGDELYCIGCVGFVKMRYAEDLLGRSIRFKLGPP